MDLFQNKNYKSKSQLRKFKEKMKDRYKINGIKFDYNKKTEDKKYFVEPRKKVKEQKNIYNEYEEFMLLKNYNKLKHQIFLREQKEREKLKQEEELFKEFRSDLNYTTILKLIKPFFFTNKRDNPFNYDIKSGKMQIERANRNIKQYRINEILKRIILHFMKINSKLNIKKKKHNFATYITQETIDEIKRKINNQKKKLQSRNYIFNNSEINDRTSNVKSDNSRKSRSNLYISSDKRKSNSYIENTNNKINSINNKNLFISSSSSYIERKPSLNKYKEKLFTNNSINYINKNSEYNVSEDCSNKYRIKRNSYYFNESKENKIINNIKEMYNIKKPRKSLLSYAPNILNNYISKNQKSENSNLYIEENTKEVKFNSLIKNNRNSINNKKPKSKLYRPKSCINIEYNNKNGISWINNKSWNKNKSCISQKPHLKVKNLPLYTTKIGDLIKEYNRIKKNSKKLKINYKERHFSTYEEIDNIIKTKEDMLMFLLKQKYFNCKFPQKKVKVSNHKKVFYNRMKECVDLIEERPSIFINFEKNLEF